MVRRITWWAAGVGLVGLLSKTTYRRFVNSRGIHDLGLSGVLPNFFYALFLTLVFGRWAALISIAAGIVYELDQRRHVEDRVLSSLGRTFDPWDVVACVAGGLLGFIVLRRKTNDSPKPQTARR